jgi:hypothetical protein
LAKAGLFGDSRSIPGFHAVQLQRHVHAARTGRFRACDRRGAYASTNENSETFRDSEDFNRECVLLEDIKDYLAAPVEKRPGFILPVPKRWAKSRDHEACPEHRRLPRYLGVAAADHYHPLLG